MLQSSFAVSAQNLMITCDYFSIPSVFVLGGARPPLRISGTRSCGHSANFAIGNLGKVSQRTVLARWHAFVQSSNGRKIFKFFTPHRVASCSRGSCLLHGYCDDRDMVVGCTVEGDPVCDKRWLLSHFPRVGVSDRFAKHYRCGIFHRLYPYEYVRSLWLPRLTRRLHLRSQSSQNCSSKQLSFVLLVLSVIDPS